MNSFRPEGNSLSQNQKANIKSKYHLKKQTTEEKNQSTRHDFESTYLLTNRMVTSKTQYLNINQLVPHYAFMSSKKDQTPEKNPAVDVGTAIETKNFIFLTGTPFYTKTKN